MVGRKPTPTALKVLRGNPGRRPLNRNEPMVSPQAPGPPTWLDLEARAEWRRVVPELDRIGMLGKIDRAALATYCSCWSKFVAAERLVQQHGLMILEQETTSIDGRIIYAKPVKNPMLIVMRDMADKVRQFSTEFGLTPSARVRLHKPESTEVADADRYGS